MAGFIELKESPHAPGVSPVRIHHREAGSGKPVVYLHGGWGYGYYPIDRQIAAFGGQFRFVMPDRTGYGQSSRVNGTAPMDFHRRAAEEIRAFLDAAGISKCILWGHSDGAVIAAMMGVAEPERYERIVLEAFHFYKGKQSSREFFRQLSVSPQVLGERSQKKLAADHGEGRWEDVVRNNAEVWVRIGESSRAPEEDLFEGELGRLAVPTLFVHGRLDPRTEPGEVERAAASVPKSVLRFLENGKHCPHCEEAVADEFDRVLKEFLEPRNQSGSR
jgi:pimeloyl-ACP methyl ester carboxylesterase